MDLFRLCDGIGLQPEVRRRVEECLLDTDPERLREVAEAYRSPETADGLYDRLSAEDPDDELHTRRLTEQLTAAAMQYDRFRALGLDDKIYFDTYKAFSRFLSETTVYLGREKFDRGYWAWRHTCMMIYRFGDLEYEFCPQDGKIHLHIPSDVKFDDATVDESFALAKKWVPSVAPAFADAEYYCNSWLLSPTLRQFLSDTSHIVRFQNRFEMQGVSNDSVVPFQFLFQQPVDTPLEELRENTSLQRKVKAFVLSGGKVGSAEGVVRVFQACK